MKTQFHETKSLSIPNHGWGSRVIFFPGCQRALVLYAYRALFTVDCVSGTYDKRHYETENTDRIDYNSIHVTPYSVFFKLDNQGICCLDIVSQTLTTILPEARMTGGGRLSVCGNFLAYVSKEGPCVCSVSEREILSSVTAYTEASNSRVLFHPSGTFYLFGNSKTVTALRTQTGEKLWEIEPVEWFLNKDYWGFSQDERYFIHCPYEQCIGVYNASDRGISAQFRKGNAELVTEAHMNAEGTLLISSSYDGKLRVWDFKKAMSLSKNGIYQGLRHETGEDSRVLRVVIEGHKESKVTSVSPSPDFKLAVSYTEWDRTFYLWDILNGELIHQISFENPIDDFKVVWHGNVPKIFVIENSEGSNFERNRIREIPPFIRISETTI